MDINTVMDADKLEEYGEMYNKKFEEEIESNTDPSKPTLYCEQDTGKKYYGEKIDHCINFFAFRRAVFQFQDDIERVMKNNEKYAIDFKSLMGCNS